MIGYLKYFRSIKRWEWYRDKPCRLIFTDLLVEVTWETKVYKGITLNPGMTVTSLDKLAYDNNLTVKQVRLALDKLEGSGELVTKRTNKGTIITLVNYSKFQVFDQDVESAGQTKGKQREPKRATTKEYKKEEERTTTIIGVVNSSDYFGESSDLRSSESELRNKDLWTELLTLWCTKEYDGTNNQLYKTYWVNFTNNQQDDLLYFLRTCKDPNLHSIWKRPIFEYGSDLTLSLQAELVKLKNKTGKSTVYRNPIDPANPRPQPTIIKPDLNTT